MKTTGTTRGNASRIVTIKDIRRVVLPDAVRIVIELDGEVPTFHDERLANPIRVFVDLSATQAAPELIDRTIRFDSDADVVRQVRLGRHPNTTTRVVVDAAGVTSYSVYPLYSPYRLVIDFFKETAAQETAAPASATPRRAPDRGADGRTTLADAFPAAAARALPRRRCRDVESWRRPLRRCREPLPRRRRCRGRRRSLPLASTPIKTRPIVIDAPTPPPLTAALAAVVVTTTTTAPATTPRRQRLKRRLQHYRQRR